jgi:prepilin-type N-terminal cleavage/methylation domain-containing protein
MLTSHSQKSGFTLIEIIIASAVLGLFMTGLFSLYSGGQSLSGQTLWIQRTTNTLRTACRQINSILGKSSYPSALTFPGRIQERDIADFGLHYYSGGLLLSTQAPPVTDFNSPATKVFYVTESTPGKIGYQDEKAASLTYHIISLTSDGKLLYHQYNEVINADTVNTHTRPSLSPPPGNRIFKSVLVEDVESVLCTPSATPSGPFKVDITCKYPRGNTVRTETAIGNPNVSLVGHSSLTW